MAIDDILNSVHLNEQDAKKDIVSETSFEKKETVSCNFDIGDESIGLPNVKIFGVGGAGNNIISYLEKIRS
jgi:cell division GTPase FtsZ